MENKLLKSLRKTSLNVLHSFVFFNTFVVLIKFFISKDIFLWYTCLGQR